MITLVDYGVGNPAAIVNMIRHIGAPCRLTSDPVEVALAERVILPGVGHYDHCHNELVRRGLVEPLTHAARERGRPLLGVCVGAQLLGHGSEEGDAPGLGWLDFSVVRLPSVEGLRVPRMGWGEVLPAGGSPLFEPSAPRQPRFYFAHSYCIQPEDRSLVAGATHYGVDYAAAVHQGNVAGVQFHPEKSHKYGMSLLRRFVEWVP